MKTFAYLSYLMYFLGGFVTTTIGSVLPQLLAHYGVSYTEGGQLVFFGAIGFILGVPISSYMLGRFTERTILLGSALLVGVTQLGLLALPPLGVMMALNLLLCIGTAALETVTATLLMEVFVGRRAVVMSYLEVSFGLGALLMPLVASLLISVEAWRFVFLVTAVLALALAVMWQVVRYSKEDADLEGSKDAETAPPPELTASRKWMLLSLFVFMIFVYTGIEGSLNNFLSSIFITYLNAPENYASISIGAFWVAMVAGRLATGWIIRKVAYGRFLLGSMLATLAVLVAFIMLKQAVIGYALSIALGLTMSGVYSITMVYANHTFPGMARLITGLITGFAGLGAALLPAVVGYTMDRAGTAWALWIVAGFAAVFVLALLVVFAAYRKPGARRGEGQSAP